jgi:NADH-quinone oxidoreductase subunit N
MTPELILVGSACALFLLGTSTRITARRAAPILAILALAVVFVVEVLHGAMALSDVQADSFGTLRVSEFAHYIKMLAAAVGAILVLLAWPGNRDATGNSAADYGTETPEFFALLLLSIAGIFLVSVANDMILLFLGIELASIPTYIMVSVSRPLPAAQEAGVKDFFLGAMSAALMLFGFSYLYGTTGTTDLHAIAQRFAGTVRPGATGTNLSPWQVLGLVMVLAGFAFKLAAVPLHFYVGDVYQGAATPMTALLSFVPKTSGIVATIKLLYVAGGGSFEVPSTIAKLVWVLAALTMTFGNILGLIQVANVKRVLAYSSVAHSGYMLVGLTALAFGATGAGGNPNLVRTGALSGVLFYLAAYGIMNAGAFGVLMLLPARKEAHGFSRGTEGERFADTSAETFEDIAGQGRNHPALGLAMAVCCFSLIGLPLTIGFFGKLYIIRPALQGHLYWLVVITMINAAISAGYYLKIVAAMFLRPEGYSTQIEPPEPAAAPLLRSTPVVLAVAISCVGTVIFGAIFPATGVLRGTVEMATEVDARSNAPALQAPTAAAAAAAAAEESR